MITGISKVVERFAAPGSPSAAPVIDDREPCPAG